jgi:hypothetical protein
MFNMAYLWKGQKVTQQCVPVQRFYKISQINHS